MEKNSDGNSTIHVLDFWIFKRTNIFFIFKKFRLKKSRSNRLEAYNIQRDMGKDVSICVFFLAMMSTAHCSTSNNCTDASILLYTLLPSL